MHSTSLHLISHLLKILPASRFVFSAEAFEIRKYRLTPSLAKPRQDMEAFLKTYWASVTVIHSVHYLINNLIVTN